MALLKFLADLSTDEVHAVAVTRRMAASEKVVKAAGALLTDADRAGSARHTTSDNLAQNAQARRGHEDVTVTPAAPQPVPAGHPRSGRRMWTAIRLKHPAGGHPAYGWGTERDG